MNKKISLCLGVFALIVGFTGANAQQRLGDNLGNHHAGKDLNMATQALVNVKGIVIGSATISNDNVALQIDGADKAMLVPRVSNLLAVAQPLNGMLVYSTAATENRFYMYQNNQWVSFAPFNLSSGQILVGDANGGAKAVTLSGDLEMDNAGLVTIKEERVTAGKIAGNTITSRELAVNEVKTEDFADAAVTSVNIAANAAGSAKFAAETVSAANLADGAVAAAKIDHATAGPDRLLTTDENGVTHWLDKSKLLMPAMQEAQIIVGQADEKPAAVHISGDALIAADGVLTIEPSSVTSAKIANGTVNTIDIANQAVTAAKFNSSTAGPDKVLVAYTPEKAQWADKTVVQGYAVGDIKAFFPHLGLPMSENWVRCTGQTVTAAMGYSPSLVGKTLPDLRNRMLMGTSSGTLGTPVGSDHVTLGRANLPDVQLTAAVGSALGGMPAGNVVVSDAAATHNHGINDPGHRHYIGSQTGGWNHGGSQKRSTYSGVTSGFSSQYTSPSISIGYGGAHTHTATITLDPLPAHSHTGFEIDMGGSGSGIPTQPQTIEVWYIMKVK